MTKSNPFEHSPDLPGVGPNTVDPATNATGPAPMGNPEQVGGGVSPSPSTGTEGWGLGKDEPDTSGQPGMKTDKKKRKKQDEPTDVAGEEAA